MKIKGHEEPLMEVMVLRKSRPAALMSMHMSVLVDSVAEVCRAAASFP
jgi:hypothetical protein